MWFLCIFFNILYVFWDFWVYSYISFMYSGISVFIIIYLVCILWFPSVFLYILYVFRDFCVYSFISFMYIEHQHIHAWFISWEYCTYRMLCKCRLWPGLLIQLPVVHDNLKTYKKFLLHVYTLHFTLNTSVLGRCVLLGM